MRTLTASLARAAADIMKVKVMKQGGIHRTVQMIEMAEAAGIKCVIGHGFGLTVDTLAEIHVAASCRNIIDGCEFVGPLKMLKDVVKSPLKMERGRVMVPDGPGLVIPGSVVGSNASLVESVVCLRNQGLSSEESPSS
jgi:muconate cycloisomerase